MPVWAAFTVKLRLSLEALDMILPWPEGLPFTRDTRQLRPLNMQGKDCYRTERPSFPRRPPRASATRSPS